jgi:phytol kinase
MMRLIKVVGAVFLCHEVTAFRSASDAKLTRPSRHGGSPYSITLPQRMSQVEEDLRAEAFEVHALNLQNDQNEVRSIEMKDSTKALLGVALGSLVSVALAAKSGVLPLPADFSYTDSLILRDMGCSILGGVLAYVYVKFVTSLAAKGTLEPRDSRKLIHTLSAPLYLLILPIFSPAGRFFAACVPFINGIRLYLAATGDLSETDLANAVSRTGDKREALGGPLVYVIVVFTAISLFWRENLVGVTALCTMAAGDGMADIIGRRFGAGNKWFFSETKSIAGSLAFWLSASLCTTGAAAWLSYTGCLELPFVLSVVAIAAVCAMMELLPFGDDNWNVPITAAILAAIFLQ